MQPSTKTDTTKEKPGHSITDIRGVVEITKRAAVDVHGKAIGPLSVITESVKDHGWICLKCDVTFLQWPAVLAHLKDMQAREMNLVPSLAADILHFAKEVLGVKLTEQQAALVASLVDNPEELRLEMSGRRIARSEATRIAAEYRRVKG